MLTLDGSTLEGGGQLTRMALSLSAITGIPVKIYSIRAGRGPASLRSSHNGDQHRSGKGDRKGSTASRGRFSDAGGGGGRKAKPAGGGLKESHLAALHWLAGQCYADVEGDEVGSHEVVFKPDKRFYETGRNRSLFPREVGDDTQCRETIKLQRPGSVWLIFQAIFPYMVFGPRSHHHQHRPHGQASEPTEPELPMYDITLRGGTNVPKSMSTEYVQQVFLPVCEKIGLPRVEVQTIRRGWTTGKLQVGEVRVKVYRPRLRSCIDSTTDKNDHLQSRQAPTSPGDLFTLPAVNLVSRGSITNISITLLTSSLETHTTLSNLLISFLTRQIQQYPSSPTNPQQEEQPSITIHPSSSYETGDPRRLYILLTAHTSNGWVLGRDLLGSGADITSPKHAKQATRTLEQAAARVVTDLFSEIARPSLTSSKSCVDEFMADQSVIFQALACGKGRVDAGFGSDDATEGEEGDDRSGSLHARTVRWIAGEILGRYGVRFEHGGWCTGVGWNSSTVIEEALRGD